MVASAKRTVRASPGISVPLAVSSRSTAMVTGVSGVLSATARHASRVTGQSKRKPPPSCSTHARTRTPAASRRTR